MRGLVSPYCCCCCVGSVRLVTFFGRGLGSVEGRAELDPPPVQHRTTRRKRSMMTRQAAFTPSSCRTGRDCACFVPGLPLSSAWLYFLPVPLHCRPAFWSARSWGMSKQTGALLLWHNSFWCPGGAIAIMKVFAAVLFTRPWRTAPNWQAPSRSAVWPPLGEPGRPSDPTGWKCRFW
jgi:hypothetical protein